MKRFWTKTWIALSTVAIMFASMLLIAVVHVIKWYRKLKYNSQLKHPRLNDFDSKNVERVDVISTPIPSEPQSVVSK